MILRHASHARVKAFTPLLPSTASHRLLSSTLPQFSSSSSNDTSTSAPPAPSAASYLQAQAEREEAEEALLIKKSIMIPELQERPWDGDEPQEMLLRRILEDTYKPLRVPGHVKKIPQPARLENRLFDGVETVTADTAEPKPKNVWDYTFRSPNHSLSPSIYAGTPLPTRSSIPLPSGNRTVHKSKRLVSALEKRWDYESGFKKGNTHQRGATGGGGEVRRPMGGMRGWNTIVEEKIEKARQEGLFRHLKGRGKPLTKDKEDGNPYIKREEFLINRIVQSQGAAPPWVELNSELESELTTFRNTLRSSWVRRTLRILSLSGVTSHTISTFLRPDYSDSEWVSKESKYHTHAISALNETVRRYNGIAPYSVRKNFVTVEGELERCFREGREEILKELKRRAKVGMGVRVDIERGVGGLGDESEIVGEGEERKKVEESMWTGFRRLVRQVMGNEGLMVEGQQPKLVERRG